MRVTDISMLRTMLRDLTGLTSQQVTAEKQLSSGKKLDTPSDDPGSAQTVLASTQALLELEQYGTNLNVAQNWLEASEEAMQSMLEALTEAMTLAEQMATGTYEADEQAAVAVQIQNLLEQIVELANTEVNGSYIFGGTATDIAPIILSLVAESYSEALGGTIDGHDVVASAEQIALGDYRLALGRDSTGATATITIAVDNTLGEYGGLGLSFDAADWTLVSAASDGPPPTGEVWQSNALTGSVTGLDSLVSVRTGETLTYTADGATQTISTECVINFSGTQAGDSVTVGVEREEPATAAPYPLSYTVTGDTDEELAAALVQAINSDPNAECTAWVENGTEVHIMADSGVVLDVTETTDASGVMDVDQTMTLQELSNKLNGGDLATGVVQFDEADLPVDVDGLPLATETVTLGDYTATWEDIITEFSDTDIQPPTAEQYATALTEWINTYCSDDYEASYSASDTGATVCIKTLVAGSDANTVALTSSYVGVSVLTGGTLTGGLNGTGGDSEAQLYAVGESDLLLSTQINATVTEVNGDDVTLRLQWYGDDGEMNTEVVTLSGAGDDNAVEVEGLGGLSIYLSSGDLYAGSEFELQLTHYQGNEEDIYVAYSTGVRMDYNWTALDLLGDYLSVNLDGTEATALQSYAGMGAINVSGNYTGSESRDITIDVISSGTSTVPPDSVELKVSWMDDSGNQQVEYVTLDSNTDRVELTDCDGVEIYLDAGDYQQGDSYMIEIEKSSLSVIDTMKQWIYALESGDTEAAQDLSGDVLDALDYAVEELTQQISTSGIRQERVEGRLIILEDEELYYTTNLTELQEVDVTETILQMTSIQTAYNAALQTISTLSDLFLVNYL